MIMIRKSRLFLKLTLYYFSFAITAMMLIGIRVIGVRGRKACCEQRLGFPGGPLYVVSLSGR